ncbi:hypothetical protein [Colwellia sp. MEBiC06753]
MAKWQGFERRKGPDIWVAIFQWLSLIGWTLFVAALLISYFAAPEQTYGITRYHQVVVRDYWIAPLTNYLYGLLWLTALLSFVSIMVSHYRTRRSTDNKYYNLILLLVICLAWVIYIGRNVYW